MSWVTCHSRSMSTDATRQARALGAVPSLRPAPGQVLSRAQGGASARATDMGTCQRRRDRAHRRRRRGAQIRRLRVVLYVRPSSEQARRLGGCSSEVRRQKVASAEVRRQKVKTTANQKRNSLRQRDFKKVTRIISTVTARSAPAAFFCVPGE